MRNTPQRARTAASSGRPGGRPCPPACRPRPLQLARRAETRRPRRRPAGRPRARSRAVGAGRGRCADGRRAQRVVLLDHQPVDLTGPRGVVAARSPCCDGHVDLVPLPHPGTLSPASFAPTLPECPGRVTARSRRCAQHQSGGAHLPAHPAETVVLGGAMQPVAPGGVAAAPRPSRRAGPAVRTTPCSPGRRPAAGAARGGAARRRPRGRPGRRPGARRAGQRARPRPTGPAWSRADRGVGGVHGVVGEHPVPGVPALVGHLPELQPARRRPGAAAVSSSSGRAGARRTSGSAPRVCGCRTPGPPRSRAVRQVADASPGAARAGRAHMPARRRAYRPGGPS